MANVVELNDLNFDREVKESNLPVLVDFYANWCGPCRKQLPVVSKIAEQFEGKAKIAKLNVDEGQMKSMEFGITSIPALMIFKDGQIVESMSGLHSESQLTSALNQYTI